MTAEVLCEYCGHPAERLRGSELYPGREDLRCRFFWVCRPCGAWVGCHLPNTRLGFTGREPFGRLANAELRQLKQQAHATFDPLWQSKHFKTRHRAYNWLANQLGIERQFCHIGMFDETQCRRVIEVCTKELGKRLDPQKLTM